MPTIPLLPPTAAAVPSKPAWSELFDPDRLGPAPALGGPHTITSAWAFGDRRGRLVRVAVIDSGVETAHPAIGHLAGGVVIEWDPDARDGVRIVEGPHDDVSGHGTACAGIIRSLAPDVELYSVRVLSEQMTGKVRCFAAGLEWALANDMDVVNLSLSTSNDDWFAEFHDLADRATKQRAMLVCALANERKTSIPSEFAQVFSVAAIDADDPELIYANPNPPAEWGAPGIDVQVAWKGGETVTATGNSFAAPHVAGLIARILGAHRGLTCWQVKTILSELAGNRA